MCVDMSAVQKLNMQPAMLNACICDVKADRHELSGLLIDFKLGTQTFCL